MRSKSPSIIRILIAVALLISLSPSSGFADGRNPESGKKSPSAATALQVTDLSGALNPEDLANALAGEGVVISNVVYTGAEVAAGAFSGGLQVVGFDSGILLTSGSAGNVVGPNTFDDTSWINGGAGDSDLGAIAGFITYDAAILEFDFVPDDDQVSFQFVFASEEYNEWVNSEYNDVFAFLVNGQNCSLVEGDPITVNTINNGNPFGSEPRLHPDLFINNDLSDGGGLLDTEMDGLTSVLTCAANVNLGQVNHLKLAIADASDQVYDSAVFLQAGSITTERRPIMVIPGMYASFNTDCFFKLPYLCTEEDQWNWFPVLGYPVYDSLLEFLRDNDYKEENGLLEVFFYDWRKPVWENVAQLKEAIAEFKGKTGADKVDLIGHSMGGLLARAYVQDEIYKENEDVAHLVTIGSPHIGTAKVYPYYEDAYFYEANLLEEAILGLLLEYARVIELQPVPVLALRQFVPSTQNLLPTWDYLYHSLGSQLKYEKDMIHRNNFLPELNEGVGLLYDRLGADGVATIAGTNKTTTERLYVLPYFWWLFPDKSLWYAWDDGSPDWIRWVLGDFHDPDDAGDGTVLVKSALLGAPAKQVIVGGESAGDVVDHLEVVEDPRTLFAISSFLQLSPAPVTLPPDLAQLLLMYVYGPVDASVTDPLGRTLAAPGPLQTGPSVDPIPGGEYLVVPGDTFQIILIPEPVEGDYKIEVGGQASGSFMIGLLDTFDPPEETSTDISEEWDTSTSQTEAGAKIQFTIPYTPGSEEVNLLAQTPLIEVPLYADAKAVYGRSLPGAAVEIRSASNNALIGTGTATPDGIYSVSLNVKLKIGQQIYPSAGGIEGITVEVLGRYNYLPGVLNTP